MIQDWLRNSVAVYRAGDVQDVTVVEQERKSSSGVLPGTLIQATGNKQRSKRSAARHRMLEMLTTWPAEGIAISLEALPFEVLFPAP